MTWQYRAIRKTRRFKNKTLHWYDIHEVYLNEKGVVHSWTENPVSVNGAEDIKGMQFGLSHMLADVLMYPIMEIRNGKIKERKSA